MTECEEYGHAFEREEDEPQDDRVTHYRCKCGEEYWE